MLEEREKKFLSPHAQLSSQSRGRRVPEEECSIRPAFQHDRDRIIHSKAFRRLKHKTQVFLIPGGDHYRTRLTHTLEVAQIARTMAKALCLNEDLTEAIALGHDLGHTPFGHAGEDILNEICPGGFRHSAQSLRVVDFLEREGRGLNLTFEVRDGILKHSKGKGDLIADDPRDMPATYEGRLVRVADIIAYINHDLDDAMRAGLISPRDIPADCTAELGDSHGKRIDAMVRDILEQSLGSDPPKIAPSRRKLEAMVKLRDFLYERVYDLPTVHGEKIVLRVLDKSNLSASLDKLGLDPDTFQQVKAAVDAPHGLILVTGPTGSGKTTTLYSALNELNNPIFNIITVEDPVEFQIPGINQVPVKKEIGLTFANALRSILRQDPDIVMIGEIRDTETAEIAIEAALTGHQVLSTMHCNDAPGAIARLDDMGIAPFLISSSVILSCAQRLMRRICSHCKEPVTYPAKMYQDLNIDPSLFDGVTLYRGRGCDRCKGSGYAGRIAIIEAMTITDELRKLIIARANTREMAKVAIGQGMRTLRMVALDRVREGVSTLEQVLVVTAAH